jgi:hypothetical protein
LPQVIRQELHSLRCMLVQQARQHIYTQPGSVWVFIRRARRPVHIIHLGCGWMGTSRLVITQVHGQLISQTG